MPETPPSPPSSLPEESGEKERVGKGRPPVGKRFRPGQSGNPRGRPKRGRELGAIVARALDEKIEAKENGRRRRMTKLEATVKQLVNRAAGGDQRAAQFVLALLPADHGRPAREEPKPVFKPGSLVVAELIRRFSPPPVPLPGETAGEDKQDRDRA